jgi:hypothetical protein
VTGEGMSGLGAAILLLACAVVGTAIALWITHQAKGLDRWYQAEPWPWKRKP